MQINRQLSISTHGYNISSVYGDLINFTEHASAASNSAKVTCLTLPTKSETEGSPDRSCCLNRNTGLSTGKFFVDDSENLFMIRHHGQVDAIARLACQVRLICDCVERVQSWLFSIGCRGEIKPNGNLGT
jgi:hypothetical protein